MWSADMFLKSSQSLKRSWNIYEFDVYFHLKFICYCSLFIMASPRQEPGSCGHIMASFDEYSKCAQCQDKGMGDDPCGKTVVCEATACNPHV